MSTYTVEQFWQAYPKYESLKVDYEVVLHLINLAYSFVSDCWEQKKQYQAIGLIVAHNIEAGWVQQIAVSGAAGVAASGGNGGQPSGVENDFTTTHYGRMFLQCLEPMSTTSALADVSAFLAAHERKGAVA